MGNLAAWLLGLVVPIARKALVALGIGTVTYAGMDLIMDQIQSAVINSIGGMPAAAAKVAAIFGFQQSVGILLAAITTRMAMTQLTKWTKS